MFALTCYVYTNIFNKTFINTLRVENATRHLLITEGNKISRVHFDTQDISFGDMLNVVHN